MAAKRYNQKQKDEVVQFIKDYDRENGRGGKAQAASKYGINPITIKAWCDKAGIKTSGKSAKQRAKAAAEGAKREGSLAVSPTVKRLARMLEIQRRLDELMLEYNGLKRQL